MDALELTDDLEQTERLHDWLTESEIERLHSRFLERKKLSYAELREEFENLDIHFSDTEYNRLFCKINENRDLKCNWSEFISYLAFRFQDDDPSSQKEALVLPISSAPIVKKSEHRSPVCCISLMKTETDLIVDEGDQNEDNADGEEIDEEAEERQRRIANLSVSDTPENMGVWITGSKEGQIRFWLPHLKSFRSGTSESVHLKMSTCILAIQALSDVSVVCTASTERELRFHDTAGPTFTLRIVIRIMPFPVCCMSYSFYANGKTNSRLIMGDFGGNVRILEFKPHLRGPFQAKTGTALVQTFWSDILKGKMPLFIVHEYRNIHSELVKQVFFSFRLNSLFCAAEYFNTKKYRNICPGLIVANGDERTKFIIQAGVTTFYVDEKNNMVITGGPDFFVRLWDIYIPAKPLRVLEGHNSGIVMVFAQPDEKKVFSVDFRKVIKVWDLKEYVLLQTFDDLVRLIPSETSLAYYYHAYMRVLLVGGRNLVIVKCNPRVRMDITDGNTHAAPVSVVLYNRLFRNVVTCGLDSYIIVWDPWMGQRKVIIKHCHTRRMYGENTDIAITAACFNPFEKLLLTGAQDGSVKIWDYNNAVCIRNMSITPEYEVTAVIWIVHRIFAIGWDQQVTEFYDVEGREHSDPIKWPIFHSDVITCADVKLGEAVVTSTCSGELVFWNLQSGQPYRRYNVDTPELFIKIKYRPEDEDNPQDEEDESRQSYHMNVLRFVRQSVSERIREVELKEGRIGNMMTESGEERMPSKQSLPISVQAVLFLQTRPMTTEHGTVLVALHSGIIQVYSHHRRGGFLKQFDAIHKTGDCVSAMTTDRENRFLFTGTAFGYIKIWLIENFCVPESEKVPINMPLLRLQFIFLQNERFLTRAKRAVRRQPWPLLLSSYKGHMKGIKTLAYISKPKILITGSHDCSCRLWSLGGRYLGTLGTLLPWMTFSPFQPVEEDKTIYRMPPDIKKVASTTTMKVLTGNQMDNFTLSYGKSTQDVREVFDDKDSPHLHCKILPEPILGKHFQLPGRSATEQFIDLDGTTSYVPVFSQLKIHEAGDLDRPCTPPALQRVANESYMDFYERANGGHGNGDNLLEKTSFKPSGRSKGRGSVYFSGDVEQEGQWKKTKK
uniref:WD repeat-containing protein on Y chromosome n=1 Tax=Stomoxys calcitrans TaxID=35570 RepID=A0A1I8PB56_STOCA